MYNKCRVLHILKKLCDGGHENTSHTVTDQLLSTIILPWTGALTNNTTLLMEIKKLSIYRKMKTEKDKVSCYWNSSWSYFERKVGTLSKLERPYPRTWECCRQSGAFLGKMMYWCMFLCVPVVVLIRVLCLMINHTRAPCPLRSFLSSSFFLSKQCWLTFLQVATWSPGRVLLGVGVTILYHRRLFFILVVLVVLRRRRRRCRLLEHRLLGRWRWGRHVWDYK